ncbi:DUF99 family protein [Deinococcus sp.]|uniref:endonuclease dU n=1 Tax=Deinococcus sp. TaxID=47478 RepID=UPI003C7AA0C0
MLVHAAGFDDAPFTPAQRGDVRVIGTVYARQALHAVLSGQVRRDGRNSTDELTRLRALAGEHLQLMLLQGIALAGFNVVDIHRLSRQTGLPVLVVSRKAPDLARIEAALKGHVSGGRHKWRLIEAAGPMEACAGVYVQRSGLSLEQAAASLAALTVQGRIPEPLRAAHLIAGGVGRGHSAGQRV